MASLSPRPSGAVLPRRPPAPRPLPRHPGFWGFFKALRDNPIAAWAEPAYRDPYMLVPGRGLRPGLLFVTEPDMLRRIFIDAVEIYDKGDIVRRRLQPFLGDSLLIAGPESWRPQRRIAAPLFSARRVEASLPAMVAVAREAEARLAALPRGEGIDAAEAMSGFAYEVISRIAFSSDTVSDPPAFSHAIAAYFDTLGRVDLASYLRLPPWIPTLDRLRARPSLALFRREIGGIVARRQARLEAEGEDALPDDLLTRLLTSPDPQTGQRLPGSLVYDDAVTFLAAGHETTANVLTWTLFLLSENPEWDHRVAEEAASVLGGRDPAPDDLPRLEALRMVVDETMRLYPPAPVIPRVAAQADRLGAVDVPPGTFVFTSPYVSHRHRLRWEEPDAFRPERFAAGCRDAIDRFAYFPFGAGPRVCIGAAFSMQEVTVALAILLQRFRFEAIRPDEVFPQATITLRPRAGLPMRVLPRRQARDRARPGT
ncbi:MAG: cytochrome P450 [Alsobacter sp.]